LLLVLAIVVALSAGGCATFGENSGIGGWAALVEGFEDGEFEGALDSFDEFARARLAEASLAEGEQFATHYWLARVRGLQARFDDARTHRTEAAETLVRGRGTPPGMIAARLNALAHLANADGEYAEAEGYLLRAVDLISDPVGGFERLVKAVSLGILSGNMAMHGEYYRARELAAEASRLAPEDAIVEGSLDLLMSEIILREGRKATRNDHASVEMHRRVEPGALLRRSWIAGECELDLGAARLTGATETNPPCVRQERALACLRRLADRRSFLLVEPLVALGACRYNTADFAASWAAYQEAQELTEAAFGCGARTWLAIETRVALLAFEMGRKEEARRRMEMACGLSRRRMSPGSALLADVLRSDSMLSQWEGRIDRSVELAKECSPVAVGVGGLMGREAITWMRWLAEDLRRRGRAAEALALTAEALGMLKALRGEPAPEVETCVLDLRGRLLTELGRPEEAGRVAARRSEVHNGMETLGLPIPSCD